MDVLLLNLSEDTEPVNVNQVVSIIKAVANFGLRPKEDQLKQIEFITKLEKLVTPDDDGDYVVEKIFHKDYGCIQALLKILSVCYYPHAVLKSFILIHKCVSQKRNMKGILSRRVSTSYIFDEGQIFINLLINIEDQLEYFNSTQRIINSINFYLLSILDIACKKDKRFCRFFDRYHVIRKLLFLLGKYNKFLRLSVILIDILRCVIKTRNDTELMPNKTFYENLETIFALLKNKKSPKIKSIVILIKLLTKYDHITEAFFETKIVNYLLVLLVNDDNLPVSYSMYRSVVLSISKIIRKDSYLEYFKTNANIRLLYRFCSNFTVTEDKHYVILLKTCSIIHACLPKRQLLPDMDKCYTHPLPVPNRKTDLDCNTATSEEDDYLSTLSEDSDVEEQEDEEEDEVEEEEEEDDDEQSPCNTTQNSYKLNKMNSNEWKKNILPSQSLQNKNLFSSLCNPTTEFSQETMEDYLTSDKDCKVKMFEKINPNLKLSTIYCTFASRVNTERLITKVAYPDMILAESVAQPQYIATNYTKFTRVRLTEILDRAINEKITNNYQIVYDLDYLQKNDVNHSSDILKCEDMNNIMSSMTSSSLKFESRFEEGNLRKVYKVNQYTYNLILAPDVNTNRKYQWFYFEVSKMKAQMPYVFNIINCDKSNTQYNHGMQPVMFSVKDATSGKIGWVRTGSDILYYRNNYTDCFQQAGIYNTLSFTIRFPYSNDVCYIAYHYPYTYSRLMTYLYGIYVNPPNTIHCNITTLCHTIAGNIVPLVTITAPKSSSNPIHKRKVVVLTSRVHPAESNASWAIEGTIRYLLQDDIAVRQLREEYIFKIVPMQNPEGVIYGSYRCGLTIEDLNRCWKNPSMTRHPEIFHIKALVHKLTQQCRRPISLYLDYHGHSRKRNFFLYGCSNKASWKRSDRRLLENIEDFTNYPLVLADSAKMLSLKSCKYSVERNRESTARVTIWREFKVKCSYTVECTYCGFDTGPYKNQTINTKHLFEIGASLLRGLWLLNIDAKRTKVTLPYLCLNHKDLVNNISNSHALSSNNDVTNNNGVLRNVVG